MTKPLNAALAHSILAQRDTWLKRKPLASSALAAEEKLFVPKGSAHVWQTITMVPGETHYRVNLEAQPDKPWWMYPSHWKIINDPKIENKPEYEVIGIDDLSGGYIKNVYLGVKFYQNNLNNSIIKDIFKKEKPDYVFHFAAYAAEGLSPFIRNFNYTNNLLATTNIVNECIKNDVKRLIFTSTLAVYGHGYGDIFDESHTPKPIDPYGVAKFACEQDIQIAGEQHGLDWCIIRPHNVYGVKQNIWDKYRNVLGIWMYQHLNNKPMTIYGDGEQTRAFSYIDDCLEPLWKSAVDQRASKQIINLGGTIEYSINHANQVLRVILS